MIACATKYWYAPFIPYIHALFGNPQKNQPVLFPSDAQLDHTTTATPSALKQDLMDLCLPKQMQLDSRSGFDQEPAIFHLP